MNENKRDTKIIWNKNGNGYDSTKISLPVPWVREMGFSKEDGDVKNVKMEFKNNQIIISKNEKNF